MQFLEEIDMSRNNPTYNEIIFSNDDVDNIIDLYVNQNLSSVVIGKLYNCSHKPILKVLKENNIDRIGASRRKYNIDGNYFDVIDNQNKAYILGFLYADGTNSVDKQTVAMTLQVDDFEILNKN